MMRTLNCGRCCSCLFIKHFQNKHLNSAADPSIRNKKYVAAFPFIRNFWQEFLQSVAVISSGSRKSRIRYGSSRHKRTFSNVFPIVNQSLFFRQVLLPCGTCALFNQWTLRWEVGQVQRGRACCGTGVVLPAEINKYSQYRYINLKYLEV